MTCISKIGARVGDTTVSLDADKSLTVNGEAKSLPYIGHHFDVHEANEEFIQVSYNM